MIRRLCVFLAVLALSGCAPLTAQQAATPTAGFSGAYLTSDRFVSFDSATLGLSTWLPKEEPWAVIVGLHGMNDYANAFHMAGPWWAEQGIATYAYDQRGFGRSPNRGLWADDEVLIEDLRTMVSVVRARHPNALIAVAGESMGGAVALEAFASERPPEADRLVLLAPAVWGWSSQPLPNKTLLWLAARVTGSKVYTPTSWLTSRIQASDNHEELIAMGRDPLMIWGARSDALYHLVRCMDRGYRGVDRVRAPTLYLYGANDEIIPKAPSFDAANRLKPTDRTAYYRRGYHLLLRDKQAKAVWADVAGFLRDPAGPLASGAPRIPKQVEPRERARVVAQGDGA
ncbi:MAG TPA: lysophospholipase [Phenylobacterium sp.]